MSTSTATHVGPTPAHLPMHLTNSDIADINLQENIMQHDIKAIGQMPILTDTNIANADLVDTRDEAYSRKWVIAPQVYWTKSRLAALNRRALKNFDRVVYNFLRLALRIEMYDPEDDGLGWDWDEQPSEDCLLLDGGHYGRYGVNRKTGTWGQSGEVWNHGDLISLTAMVLRIDDYFEAASRLGGYLKCPWKRYEPDIVNILIVRPKHKADPVPMPVGLGTNFLTWLSERIDDRIANPAPEGRQE